MNATTAARRMTAPKPLPDLGSLTKDELIQLCGMLQAYLMLTHRMLVQEMAAR